jgi:hypothetical protein
MTRCRAFDGSLDRPTIQVMFGIPATSVTRVVIDASPEASWTPAAGPLDHRLAPVLNQSAAVSVSSSEG